MPPPAFAATAFGLTWASDHPLSQFQSSLGVTAPDITVTRLDQLPARPGGRPINNGEIFDDGARFRFGTAIFDTYGTSRVTWCAPDAPEVPAAFYGTVAAIILAWRGLVPIHGSAVALDGRALLIAGPPGAGKSTLCAALVRQGARLVSDDLSALLPLTPGETAMLAPGRPAIRLAAPSRAHDDKDLHPAPLVEHAVAWDRMVVLRDAPLPAGPAAATDILRAQLFRPAWMRALPFARAREASLFLAAQQIDMIVAPRAGDRPDLSADDKAATIRDRLTTARPVELCHG